MVTLYDSAFSTCPQKARFALEEKGVEYEAIEIDMYSPERRNLDSWFREINPTGVLPVLSHEGRFIRESTVICDYVDEAFDGPLLMPADPYWRAVARLWIKRFEVDIHVPHHLALNYALWFAPDLIEQGADLREYLEIEAPQRRGLVSDVFNNGINSRYVRDAVAAFDLLFDDMEAALSQTPWLGGEEFSLGEVGSAPWVLRICEELGLAPLFLDERPKVVEWFERVQRRPAFRRAIDVPGALEWIPVYKRYGDRYFEQVDQILSEARRRRRYSCA